MCGCDRFTASIQASPHVGKMNHRCMIDAAVECSEELIKNQPLKAMGDTC